MYVRGRAARRGIGILLLQHAEDRARAHGANSPQIQASLAGVEFYQANGFEELSRGEADLLTGQSNALRLYAKVAAQRSRSRLTPPC